VAIEDDDVTVPLLLAVELAEVVAEVLADVVAEPVLVALDTVLVGEGDAVDVAVEVAVVVADAEVAVAAQEQTAAAEDWTSMPVISPQAFRTQVSAAATIAEYAELEHWQS